MLRALFISLSGSRSLRAVAERSSLGRRLSSRFVAGTQPEDVLGAAGTVNEAGLSVSIDNLGENVSTAEESSRQRPGYTTACSMKITARRLDANISLKLTHMGLDVDEKLAYEQVSALVAKAASMTPPKFRPCGHGRHPLYAERTLEFVRRLHRGPGNQGRGGSGHPVLMCRSESDVTNLLSEGIRIRLCKGAATKSRPRSPSNENPKWMPATSN